MIEYVYLLWATPGFCYDGCCDQLEGAFLDKEAAYLERDKMVARAQEQDLDLGYEVGTVKVMDPR